MEPILNPFNGNNNYTTTTTTTTNNNNNNYVVNKKGVQLNDHFVMVCDKKSQSMIGQTNAWNTGYMLKYTVVIIRCDIT